jgi:hypothetical protein
VIDMLNFIRLLSRARRATWISYVFLVFAFLSPQRSVAQTVINPAPPATPTGATSVTGTAGQITCAPTTGSVVCGFPSASTFTLNGATVPASAAYVGTNSSRQIVAASTPGPTTNQNIRSIVADFGDFTSTASALTASAQACGLVQFAGTIQRVVLTGTPSGSVTVDVRTVALASWTGPSSTSSIAASDIPALSSQATPYIDSTLTGWTTAITADTMVCFYLTSPTSVSGVQAILKIQAN